MKPKFDPSQPFTVVTSQAAPVKPKFDPSQPFTVVSAKEPSTTAEDTALEGFGNGAAFGYLPQLQAATEIDPNSALDADLRAKGFKITQPEGYVARRDENIARQARQAKEHPKVHLASEIGGGLASGIATSSLMPNAGYKTLLGRLHDAAKAGVIIGAVANPGDKKGELNPVQLPARIENAAVSGVLGPALQPVAEGLVAAKDGLTRLAKRAAFKALGPYQRQVIQNSENIERIGGNALEEGVISPWLASHEKIADRARDASQRAGKNLEGMVDDMVANTGMEPQYRPIEVDSAYPTTQTQDSLPLTTRTHEPLDMSAPAERTEIQMGLPGQGPARGAPYVPTNHATPAARTEIQMGLPGQAPPRGAPYVPADHAAPVTEESVQMGLPGLGQDTRIPRQGEQMGAPLQAPEYHPPLAGETVPHSVPGEQQGLPLQAPEYHPPLAGETVPHSVTGEQPGLPLSQGKTTPLPGNAEHFTDSQLQPSLPLRQRTGQLPAPGQGASREEIVQNLFHRLMEPETVQGSAGRNAAMRARIMEQAGLLPERMTIQEVRTLKKNVKDLIKWDRLPGADIPESEQFLRGLYGQLIHAEETLAEKLATDQGGAALKKKFVDAKNKYGDLLTAEQMAERRGQKEFANQFLGLGGAIKSSMGVGLGAYFGEKLGGHEGAKTGAFIGGAAGVGAHRFGKNYGSQVAAVGANAMARLLQQLPDLRALIHKNPAVGPMILQAIKNKGEKQ